MSQFQLMKELKKNLEDKAQKAKVYIAKNEVLRKTLHTLCEECVKPKDEEIVSLDFYRRSIKLCFYGLANRVY